MMRWLSPLAVLVLALAACGGSSTANVKITFGRSGGTMVPSSITIAPDGTVTGQSNLQPGTLRITNAAAGRLSSLVRDRLPGLKSKNCPGTFPDESAEFITALGKTVTVRGTCEPAFTKLWNMLDAAAGVLPV